MPDGALLFLHALTGLHPGSGAALDVVDLPVQRERHTNWPLIPGSSLKGVMRAVTRPEQDTGRWTAVFGPDTTHADKHAGSVAVTDARVLAFPVRSLKGVFAWVTCPAVLHRFRQDAMLAGQADSLPELPPAVAEGTLYCADGPLVIDGAFVMLEEFDFRRVGGQADWAAALADRVTADDALRARIRTHLVIASDDDFSHFVTYATEVTARIGLDPETKTVNKGALFYQEVLPPETLFYAVLLGEARSADGWRISGREALDWLAERLPPIIQIGGDETIGRGFCATRLTTRARLEA